jgi:DNA-binding NarL/FixJ family response regulator
MIRLVVVDETRLFGETLATRIAAETDIEILHCTTGSAALLDAIGHSPADIVLGDARLFPTGNPAVARLWERGWGHRYDSGSRFPDAHSVPAVVLLSNRSDDARITAYVRCGVRGWVPRAATTADLLDAIRSVADGGTWIPMRSMTTILNDMLWSPPATDPAHALLTSLTPRQREVLSLLMAGLGRTDVANRLQLSTNTVRTHIQCILSKLDVNSCVAAVALVRHAGYMGRGGEPTDRSDRA